MRDHKRNSSPDRRPARRSAAGWRELHAALMAGIPRGAEIAMLLDGGRFSYPTAPSFESDGSDLCCYRIIHRAWREQLLPEFLQLLELWRAVDGSLCEAARCPRFQTALLEFMFEHRREGLPAMVECFTEAAASRAACASGSVSIEATRHRLEMLWNTCRSRCAA